MEADRFKELLEELDGNSVKTLAEKNAKYAVNGDCLHNFRSGADIAGGTPAQACWGYLTKHLVALRDKVKKNDFSDREDFLEKCQDTINYIRFLWCIGNDENHSDTVSDSSYQYPEGTVLEVQVYDRDYDRLVAHYTQSQRPVVSIDEESESFIVRHVDMQSHSSVCETYSLSDYKAMLYEKRGENSRIRYIEKK